MDAEAAMGFLRRKPKLTPVEMRTQELLEQQREQQRRIARLRATGTVITVKAKQGKARSA